MSAASESLTIHAADGTHSEATLFRSDEAPPRSIVVCLPAMGVPARYYHDLARALARPGIAVVTAELRGIGSSSVRARRGLEFGYLERLRYDLPALVAALRARSPAARLLLFGHSLGAHLAAMHASTAPDPPAALIFVAAGTSYHASWPFPRNLVMLTAAGLVRVVSRALGYFPGRYFGFFGREARRQVLEWAVLTVEGRFEVRGSEVDFERVLAGVTLPVLAISIEGDSFAPEAALDHLLSKLPSARVTRDQMSAAQLGARALDHFNWAKHPTALADRVAEWIEGLP